MKLLFHYCNGITVLIENSNYYTVFIITHISHIKGGRRQSILLTSSIFTELGMGFPALLHVTRSNVNPRAQRDVCKRKNTYWLKVKRLKTNKPCQVFLQIYFSLGTAAFHSRRAVLEEQSLYY